MAQALQVLSDGGNLDVLLRKLPGPLFGNLRDKVLGNIDTSGAAQLSQLTGIDKAFKILAPYIETQISKWTPAERRPLYVLPAGLDPDMTVGSENERIKNLSSLQNCLRD